MFKLTNPGCTVDLGLTQPLTEMSTKNLPGGKGWLACKADFTVISDPVVKKMWEPEGLLSLHGLLWGHLYLFL
jgi:hypothetical protein